MAVNDKNDPARDSSVFHLAKKLAFLDLGPSAEDAEVGRRALSFSRQNLGHLYDLFLRSSGDRALPKETRSEDFADWYFAEKAKLEAA